MRKKRFQKFSFGKSYCAHPQFIPDHLYLWNFILCLLRDHLKTRVTHLWSRVHQLCVCLIKNYSFTPCWLIFRSFRLSSEMALASLSYLVNGGKEALTQFLTKHNSLEGTLMSIESTISRSIGNRVSPSGSFSAALLFEKPLNSIWKLSLQTVADVTNHSVFMIAFFFSFLFISFAFRACEATIWKLD